MFIASVCPSVCPSVCLKPKFGRLKPKFDEADPSRGPEKLSSAPRSTSSIYALSGIRPAVRPASGKVDSTTVMPLLGPPVL